MSERDLTQAIGPPDTPLMGMNTTLRRQQLPAHAHVLLRNLRLQGEAFTRVGGRVRLLCGARRAKSLSSDGDAGTYVTIPYQDDSVNVTEINLPTTWTFFASYRPDDLSDDILVAGQTDNADGATVPWRVVHGTNGKITARCTDADGNTTTVTTSTTHPAHRKVEVLVYRDGATAGIIANDAAAVTEAATLSATAATLASSEAVYLASWSGRASGSQVTYYEVRLLRRADTSKDWRLTQYPHSGRFGDADLVFHLLCDEGTGTALTDYSRLNHSSIALTGSWTWNSTTERQVCEIVTGLHVMEKANGRKWLLCCVGRNYYRVPLN